MSKSTEKRMAERAAIEAAMTHLLTAQRTDSRHWPGISELARVAGVKRSVLYDKHTDLKDEFQAKLQQLKENGASLPPPDHVSKEQALEDENARLRHEYSKVSERETFYALALNAIGEEFFALASRHVEGATIVPFLKRRPRS